MYEESQSPRGCFDSLRQEFQCDKLCLSHEPAKDFCLSQWQIGQRSLIWLIYRWILAIFFSSSCISSIFLYFMDGRWFVYFTSWGFSLCMFACLLGAIIATLYYWDQQYFDSGSYALKIYWLLHTTALVVALLITLTYWSLVYPHIEKRGTLTMQVYDIMAHACTSMFMLMDHFVVCFPTRIMHFIYPFVFSLTYAHFSYFYYLAGGTDVHGRTYIYAVLNWAHPKTALTTVCCSLSMVFVMHFILFCLYRIRLRLSKTEDRNNGNDI